MSEEATNEVTSTTGNEVVPAPPRKQVIATRSEATLYEMSNQQWRIVSRDATAEDLEGSAFYSAIGEKLRSFDKVAVVTGAHYYDVLITYAERGRPVQAKILARVPIPIVDATAQPTVPEGYAIKYDHASQTYKGVRTKDDHPMTPSFSKQSDAFSELMNHAVFRNPRPNAPKN